MKKNKVVTYFKHAGIRASIFASTLATAGLMGGMTVFASGTLPTQGKQALTNMTNAANGIFQIARDYVWIIIALAILVCGALYIVGGEEGKQRANKWVPRILIGTGLIVLAVHIGAWISGLFGQTTTTGYTA